MKTATLIYNPIAGRHPRRREKQIQEIVAVLRACSIAAKPARTLEPGTAGRLAQGAVEQGDDLILVCGGDGTLNEVINGVAPGNTPLGVLPGGTANIAAKELALPHDPVQAARQLPAWSPRRVALGLASGFSQSPNGVSTQTGDAPSAQAGRRYFLSVAGIGFDAYVVHRLSPGFKMTAGVSAFILEALRQAWRYSFPPFRCSVEGREFQASFAVIHRSRRYAGWLHLAPNANLFQDRLSVCMFNSARGSRYLLYAAAALARQHLRLADVKLVEAHSLACASTGSGARLRFELDGELAGQLPVTFEVVPDALTLLVPA